MKKKLSMLMVALVAIAAFATTMSLQMARRAVSELTVISEATTWDFSSGVTLSSTHEGDLKYTGDDKNTEHIYANIEELTFGENFKADALAFTGEYPFRNNEKKFAQNGTLHFKTSVAGKIVVKFSDTGSSASATAVKRYLVVNGDQTTYWASRENNGDEPYAAQLNVTTDEIEVPAGDITIAGSSAIVVSYVSWAPNATPEPATQTTSTYVFTTSAWKATKDGVAADWTSNKAGNGFNNNGVQVTTGTTGAGATSPESYNNITKIVVTYNTNKTAGAGTFDVKIGDNDAVSKDWAYSSSAEDGRGANFTLTYDYATPQSGAVTITANTTTNSIYVVSIAITHDAAEPGPGPQPAGPTTLINYPTSQEGITIGGTTTFDNVKIHENADAVPGIKFANGYTSSGAVNDNKALLEVEGGFKAGDKITIAGAFNNSDDTKMSKIDIFTMDAESKPTVLFTTQQFVNGRTSAGDPAAEEFTLTADVDKLYLGRNGGTGTFVTLLTITRPGEEPQPAEGEIVISPASGDIAAALTEATAGKEVKSITINLTKDVTYTVSAALVTPADFTINGNGATIDASALETNLIQMAAVESPTEWTKADVTISGVTVKGLKKALFYSTNKKYIAENFIIDNCVVELAADATTIDYTKGSTAKNITVTNSTFYAPTATTKSFYSSQSGEKYTEYDSSADAMQTFTFTNNTMYNLAPTKNFFTHRQSNQKWLTYDVKNNIFVNCGKSGQVIKGMNGGQGGTNPTWAIDGNIFNFNGVDTGATEETGDADEPVKNSVAGVVTFPAAADGNFDGAFVAPDPAAVPAVPGDPRWTVTVQTTFATIAELKALADKAEFGFTSEALVVAQGKSGNYAYTYIKDETGSTVIFDKDGSKTPAEAVGKKLAKDWVGSVSIYHGLFELVPAAALSLAAGDAQDVEYPVVDFDYVTAEHAAEVVMLSGVSYQLVNNEDIIITKGEQQLAALNKFGLTPGFATKDVEYNIIGAINVYDDKVEFWPIEFAEKPTVDITVSPEDGTDISAAIDEASKGHFVRNITINLAAVDGGSAKYTITKSIEAAGSLTINGNSAIIDASALEAPFVTTPDDNPAEWIKELAFFMSDVTITGLSQALFYSAGKNRAYETFMVNNSIIEVAGDVTVFDFTKGSVAVNFMMAQSTIYAPTATTKSLYSSQGGQKATELSSETVQKFNLAGNTLYNLATGKNFFSHRQSNQKWLTYFANNNIFVNCGKNGQTIKGLNGGQGGKNPTWGVSNNAFNFVTYNEDGTFLSEDTGAKEDNGDSEEPIANTYAGSVYFKDAANANFAIDAASAAAVAGNVGDTRWGTYEVAHYNIMVSEEALQYADITVQPFALEDEIVKVTVTEKNGYKLKELIAKVGTQTTLKVTDNSFIMPPANVAVDALFDVIAADYELAPAAGTDIAAALEGLIIRNLKLTLAEGGAYTLTKSIELGGNLEIIGNGATIDASALAAPFVNLSATPEVTPTVDSKTDEATGETTETILAYPLDKIAINGVIVKGLAHQLVKSNNLYLVKDLTVENSVVERLGAQKKPLFDFSGGTGGNVINLTVDKSTLYSDATTTHQNGDFFTSQSSKSIDQMGVDVTAEGFTATTAITNSTLYAIANGKTTSSLRKNSQAYMRYVVKNNIIVNSGKSGQFLKGLNAGQAGTDDNFDVDTNLFNFNDDVVAEQKIGSTEENIKNSVNAIVTFADAAAGDFNMSIFKDPRVAELPAIGDPRWSVTGVTSGYAINVDEAIENGTVTPSKTWSAADETIKLTVTPAEGYELETLTAKIGATEIEIAEDKSFIMPAADVTISATFAAVPKLYIIGGPKDWKLDDMTELKYNLETQTYELDYAPTATAYFAFADKQFTAEEAAAEGAWDVFNANNRYALGEGDVDAVINGEPAQLQKVNGTIILKAGTYKISVTKDLKVTITGEVAPEPTEDVYIIAGSSAALLGTTWDGSNEANKLTLNETTGLWEKTYEGVALTKGTIEFKIVKNGTTWIPDGMGNNHTCEIPADGTYDVKVTFNAANPEKVDDYEMVATVATGINAIAVDKLDNAVIYNLQGVRIDKSQAKGGVFIVNGKKTAIK